jgi:hypothetical protein
MAEYLIMEIVGLYSFNDGHQQRGFINAGIEIVPVREFAREMSTGVSYFEQFVWDLEQRGVSDIDIPVLILGIR